MIWWEKQLKKILTLASRRKVLMERKVVGVVCCSVFIAYCIECPTQSLLLMYLLLSKMLRNDLFLLKERSTAINYLTTKL